MRDPLRDLPRVIHSSIAIAFASFTLMVTALYVTFPMSVMRENETPVVVSLLAPISMTVC
jgi:amino acid transporter